MIIDKPPMLVKTYRLLAGMPQKNPGVINRPKCLRVVSKLKCPVYVASEMSGFMILPKVIWR